jgi:hypothetical protein
MGLGNRLVLSLRTKNRQRLYAARKYENYELAAEEQALLQIAFARISNKRKELW